MGFCDANRRVGTPLKPNRVFSPMGLFPTAVASGNTGLVEVLRIRAMDPIYSTLTYWIECWREDTERLPAWKPLKGGMQTGKIMPDECFASKGYPLKLDHLPDEIKYRFAGIMVPVPYTSRFIEAVVRYLEEAGCTAELTPKCNEYDTYFDSKLQQDCDEQGALFCAHTKCSEPVPVFKSKRQAGKPRVWRLIKKSMERCKEHCKQIRCGGIRKGYNRVHNTSRNN